MSRPASLAFLLVASCVSAGTPSTPPAPAAAAPPASTQDALGARATDGVTSSRLDDARVQAEADRILAAVAQARELPVKTPVRVRVANKAQVRSFAKDAIYEHNTKQQLQLQGRIDQSLGVIPANADFEAVLLELLEDGILGFYDPKTKLLYIGDFVSNTMLSQVVGHEIAHGLQDMHFDLESRMQPIRHRVDEEEALRYLIEGGAQAAYLTWVAGSDGLVAIDPGVLEIMVVQTLELADLASPYPILARELQLPYVAGTATVVKLVMEDGWNAINALYKSPPTTTEQMLHIEKLRARERPRPVQLDHAAIELVVGKPVVWHDQIGEASLLAMLAEAETASTARQAAAGWGGDALVALESAGEPVCVVAVIAWDSRRDASEFEASWSKYANEQLRGTSLVDRRRDTVLLATQLPKLDLDRKALTRALWDAVNVGGKAKSG